MYLSTVKEKFNTFFKGEVQVLFDLDDQKVLIVNEDMLYDLYKSKLTDPQPRISIAQFLEEYDLELVAKRQQYENEFNLLGDWYLSGATVSKVEHGNSLTNLIVKNSEGAEKYMFPSRFKFKELIKK